MANTTPPNDYRDTDAYKLITQGMTAPGRQPSPTSDGAALHDALLQHAAAASFSNEFNYATSSIGRGERQQSDAFASFRQSQRERNKKRAEERYADKESCRHRTPKSQDADNKTPNYQPPHHEQHATHHKSASSLQQFNALGGATNTSEQHPNTTKPSLGQSAQQRFNKPGYQRYQPSRGYNPYGS